MTTGLLLAANEVEIFECKDPGICRDIDTPADLKAFASD